MNKTNISPLPPLPPVDASGPMVCAVIRLYLAVWSDLSPEQSAAVQAHVQTCAQCTAEQALLMRATQFVAGLDASAPSRRVDEAVMAAIQARKNTPEHFQHRMHTSRRLRKSSLRFATFIMVVAFILLTVFTTSRILKLTNAPQQAFLLPTTLSWDAYVLYNTQTKLDPKGKRYRISCYHDLATNRSHVETVEDSSLDVVTVSDGQKTLGMDEIHHVAQWGAQAWDVDESMFDLDKLRNDMQAKRAVYLGMDHFRGQSVYRIRNANGLVLLLNMHYHPVNVLEGAVGPGTGEPMYDTVRLLPPSEVPQTMWNMTVPAGFQMGTLPTKL